MNREREVNEWVMGEWLAAKRREEKKMEMQWTAELQSRKMGVKEKRWRRLMARRRDKWQTRSMYRATHQVG